MNLKKLLLRILRVIISMKIIIKIGDFDFDNILLDKKLYENILIIFDVLDKYLIGAKPFVY